VSAAAAERRFAGSAAITAVLQIASMGIGGVLAILILHEFGKSGRTDGLFAAYGVYNLVVVLAQTFRTTVVPRLGTGEELFRNFDRFGGGTLALFLLSGVLLVVAGGPVSDALTGSDSAAEAAQSALRIFWLASGAQLLAALGAAVLAVRGEFALPGFAYVLGGLVSLGMLVALAGGLGTDAVAAGVAAGSALTAVIVVGRLLQIGYRPRLGLLRPSAATVRSVTVMLTGAVAYIVGQLTYVVSIAFAAHIGEGAVTLYTYAFFAAQLVLGATATPAGLVLVAPLSEGWDRRVESLRRDLLAVFRTGAVLITVALAAAAFVGAPIVDLVLGANLDAGDPATVAATFLALAGMLFAALGTTVPMLAAFALDRYGRVALAALVSAAMHVALTAAASTIGTVEAIGVATSLSGVTFLLLVLGVVYGRGFAAPALLLAREIALLAALAAAAFAVPAAAALAVGGTALNAVWLLAGGIAFGLLLRRLAPGHWELLGRMRHAIPGLRVRPVARTEANAL
jgi:peptidoglycan biosynthesis protein MviN/MurJ (putative lipid II flippase)